MRGFDQVVSGSKGTKISSFLNANSYQILNKKGQIISCLNLFSEYFSEDLPEIITCKYKQFDEEQKQAPVIYVWK